MFGKRLRELRLNTGVSQTQLAEKLYVAPATICSWEQGRSVPDCEKLVAICRYYQVSADHLLGLSPSDPRQDYARQKGLTEEELTELERYAEYMTYRRQRRCVGKRGMQ